MSRLFPTKTQTAYDRYVRDLSSATKHRTWIHDPSFALGTDEMVYEKVRRDAISAQAMIYRRHLVAGREVLVEPAAANDKAHQVAAKIVEELLKQIMGFGDARFCLSQAIFRGSAYTIMEGRRETQSLAGLPAVQWWIPKRLLDVDRRRFRLAYNPELRRAEWLFWSVERDAWEPLQYPEWFVRHVYQRTEDSLGYGRGLLDALHYYQASKMRVVQEGLSAAERFGQGFILVGVDGLNVGSPGRSNDAVARQYLDRINKHRARNAFVHDKLDEVKLLEGFGQGWQLIRELLNYLDNAIRVLVLGANLPTSATSGGSFALAEVQQSSTEALIAFDRELLAETLTRDLVGFVWAINRPAFRALGLGGVRPPVLSVRQEKKADPESVSRLVESALRSGLKLKTDEVYRKLGFTAPGPEDEVLSGAPAPPGQGAPVVEPPLGAPRMDFAAVRDRLQHMQAVGRTGRPEVLEALERCLSPTAA